jgi:hypothetical protein
MKKFLIFTLTFLVSATLLSQQVRMPLSTGKATSVYSKTYANSQVDTVIIVREAGVTGLAFSAFWADSARLAATSAAVVKRLVNGNLCPAIGSDTLSLWSSSIMAEDTKDTPNVLADGNSKTGTITLAPLADAYVVIVSYLSTGNGTHLLTTKRSPAVTYIVQKQYGN